MDLKNRILAGGGKLRRRAAADVLADRPEALALWQDLAGDEPVYVSALSMAARNRYQSSRTPTTVKNGKPHVVLNLANAEARLLVLALVNEGGQRIFEDRDADALGALDSAVLEPLYAEALKLSNMDPAQDRKAARRFLQKNPSGGQPSGSPASSANGTSHG